MKTSEIADLKRLHRITLDSLLVAKKTYKSLNWSKLNSIAAEQLEFAIRQLQAELDEMASILNANKAQ